MYTLISWDMKSQHYIQAIAIDNACNIVLYA